MSNKEGKGKENRRLKAENIAPSPWTPSVAYAGPEWPCGRIDLKLHWILSKTGVTIRVGVASWSPGYGDVTHMTHELFLVLVEQDWEAWDGEFPGAAT